MSHSLDDDLNARSRRWVRTGDPSALWPGIDVGALTGAARAIEAAVACALDGRRSGLDGRTAADARVIGIAALVLGVGPLLGSWIECGLLEAHASVAAVLAEHLRHGRARVARIRDGIRPAMTALAGAGVRPVLIKGFHAAHTYYPEAGVRPFADVDAVVPPEQMAPAERVLSGLGFGEGRADRPFKCEWVPPGADPRIRSLELWHAESPWTLELHSGLHFADLYRYGVKFADARTAPSGAGGIDALALDPSLRLVTTAAHLSTELHSMRLLRLVEMIQMIRAGDPDAIDWTEVREILDRSGATRFVYPPFALIERLAPGTVPSPLLERARLASSRLARHVVAHLGPSTPVLSGHVSLTQRLMWASTPSEFVDRVRRLLVPDGDRVGVLQGRLHRLVTGRVGVRFGR